MIENKLLEMLRAIKEKLKEKSRENSVALLSLSSKVKELNEDSRK
jgi:hypothetical protein